jgi:hypothetical protein
VFGFLSPSQNRGLLSSDVGCGETISLRPTHFEIWRPGNKGYRITRLDVAHRSLSALAVSPARSMRELKRNGESDGGCRFHIRRLFPPVGGVCGTSLRLRLPPARGICGREEAVDVGRVSWRDHREITRADGEILRSTRAFVYVAGC